VGFYFLEVEYLRRNIALLKYVKIYIQLIIKLWKNGLTTLNKKCFNYSTNPLKPSAYFRDLVLLANLKFSYYSSDDDEEYSDEEDEGEEDIPNFSYEAHYETKIAYTLTYGDVEYIDYVIKLKEITKIRLNKMIASEPVIEII
jgi:hypothetical protein